MMARTRPLSAAAAVELAYSAELLFGTGRRGSQLV
jgi:hypothetical protein